ncbi:hypothetical protein CISIN_1g034977mg [Citrus sinensis]|uniref:Uncharacterized protein n=1 Tax=Citrus sinensis TaxID=2711 RepID=A0A067D9Q3_CITSI|nr:hypothetical protein CISIN_1g034977mg [Citrus sinensis]
MSSISKYYILLMLVLLLYKYCLVLFIFLVKVASWMSFDTEPPVIKWTPGSLMFVTGSSELSFWIPDLSKLGAYVGRK